MAAFWLNFLYHQLFTTPPYPTTDFTGQTVVITGSNTGLGLEASRHFTRLGAGKVILAVRSLEKGETAKKDIEASTGRKDAVEVWQLDLSSYDSVKAFAKKVETLKRLDAVVENAAINAEGEFQLAEDNESSVTVNVVSTFLLALMILPKLRETSTKYNVTPHLVVLTSELHFITNLPEKASPSIFDELNNKETTNIPSRYPVTKLLEVLCARELVSRMKQNTKPNVIVNLVNPGFCYSTLVKTQPLAFKAFRFLFGRSTEAGSRTLVAGVEAGEESNGQYMSESKSFPPSPFVLSKEGEKTQKRVWDELSAKLEKIQPGIMANV